MKALQTRTRWVGSILRETVAGYLTDKAPMMGAAVAFYSVLALAPLLVLIVGVAGVAFGEASARARMEIWIERAIDGPAARMIVQLLEHANAPGSVTLPSLFSLALAVYYTARLFNALQHALNHIWNVREEPASGVKGVVKKAVRKRSLSVAVMLLLGFLLLCSLAIETALPIIARGLAELPGAWYLYRLLVLVGSMVAVGIGVAFVYRILPDVRLKWSYLWGGAMFTGVLLVIGKLLLGLYLGSTALLSVTGAAGSVFALLLWAYYSAQVFFFGAELTQVVARRRGHGFGALPIGMESDGSGNKAKPDDPSDREPMAR